MTEQEIIEGNRLIMAHGFSDYEISMKELARKTDSFFLKVAQYHKSYDWLMPVWHKFRDLRFDNHSKSNEYFKHCDMIMFAITKGPIEHFYELQVAAIKWYNSLNK